MERKVWILLLKFYFIILTVPSDGIGVGEQDSILIRLHGQNPVLGEERADSRNEFLHLQVVENESLEQAEFFAGPNEASLTPGTHKAQNREH